MILTKQHLDAMGCDTPGCDHSDHVLYFSAACHPKGRLEIAYSKASGTLLVTCKQCKREVAELAVAESYEADILFPPAA